MDDFVQLFEAWGVKFRLISASDPFYSSTAAKKRAYQGAMGLKFEGQCWLPHRNRWLSVASFNLHEKILVDAYSIDAGSEAGLWSGCVGYGYERMVYALYSQFGDDPRNWPDTIRHALIGA